MTQKELLSFRLHNQLLVNTAFNNPVDVVSWMGAIQAQEYGMTKWAIGLRTKSVIDADVEEAFNNGHILRTHVLRPTWHFVSPADIRWMIKLTAPRVNLVNAYMYRKMELDSDVFRRAARIVERALSGNQFKTRPELQQALASAKINADGIRLICLVMKLELDGLLCSRPRVGKQFSYALLEERVPAVTSISSEESLMKLADKYFSSRGPASARDFSWWSGLTIRDAGKAIDMLKTQHFEEVLFDGETLIHRPQNSAGKTTTFLMPEYDEYGIGYKNREALFVPGISRDLLKQVPGKRTYMLVVDGCIAGTWTIDRKQQSNITAIIGYNNTPVSQAKVQDSIARYIAFTTNKPYTRELF